MNFLIVQARFFGVLALLAVNVQAAVPVEREVQSVRAVQVYGADRQNAPRPIGAIDFSATGSAGRRLGPWNPESDAFEATDGVIFYDDGSATNQGVDVQRARRGESQCTTLGNVTVCR